jgi:hypothetical protein
VKETGETLAGGVIFLQGKKPSEERKRTRSEHGENRRNKESRRKKR